MAIGTVSAGFTKTTTVTVSASSKAVTSAKKGQKTALGLYEKGISKIKVCFGWNILDTRCDMDASAFLLGENGRVLDERWLVFYNQPLSPDRSVSFLKAENGSDREQIYIDLKKLNLAVQKLYLYLQLMRHSAKI